MKKILCSIMVMLLSIASINNVHAEDFVGSDDWHVEFSGDEMISNFETKELSEKLSSLQPGDKMTFELTLENKDSQSTDWYMTNEVLSSFENSQEVADNGGYTYILTYTDHNGKETVLYDSNIVGGEKDQRNKDGLHEATDSLDEWFFLDRLAPTDKGYIELIVALDGETQGNAYQDTLAKLQMNFAVEKVKIATTTTTQDPKQDSKQNHNSNSLISLIKTGDTTNILLYAGLALASALLIIIRLIFIKKNKGGQKI